MTVGDSKISLVILHVPEGRRAACDVASGLGRFVLGAYQLTTSACHCRLWRAIPVCRDTKTSA